MPKEVKPARKAGVARLWELAGRQKGLVAASCILSVISVAVSFVPFIAVYMIIREVVANILNFAALNKEALVSYGWWAFGGAVGAVVINFLALMCSHIGAFNTLYYVKLDFMRHLGFLPMGFHTGNATGKMRKVVDENIEKLEGFLAHQLPDLAGSMASPIFILVILFVFDWRLGLASFVPIIAAYLLQMQAMGTEQAKTFIKKYQDSLEDMNNASVEYVRGISVVKAFNQTIYSFRKFHGYIRAYTEFVMQYTKAFTNSYIAFVVLINNVYLFLAPVIILLAGGAADYTHFALAALFYLVFSVSIPGSFMKLMYVSQNMRMISDGISRMDTVLDIEPLKETDKPKKPSSYDVTFEDVGFTYNGEGGTEAISHVSFTAKQGAVTALVGPSGSGKSTLAHLIPRFYDVAGGAIKIGGVDIRDMASEELMKTVAFVFQDVFLFKQSILENIKIGNKDATREEIISAARVAQCHEFIRKLPNGYDTVIGTAGIHLSGGERQRLVIARAILKNAPVIVLDEATAFADPENEQKIQAAFEKLMKNKTVILIAHRLSTVRDADKIVVIDKGLVVEEGKHGALAKASGRYAAMWEQYNAALNWSFTEGKEARQHV